jgi:DNA polymerase-1
MKKFLLIDGYNVVFRAFYAYPPLNSLDLKPASVIYGFIAILLQLITEYQPDYLMIAFDKGKTFRHKKDEKYKAQRKETPEEITYQVPILLKILEELGVKVVTYENYEADDILASYAKKYASSDLEVLVFSGDNDMLQIVNDENVFVISPNKKRREKLGKKEVIIKYGITPEQIPDYKALVGDSSDNLMGVKGIGPKTASKLLVENQDLDGVYKNLKSLKENLQEKLNLDKESAYHCKEMAKLVDDLKLQNLEDFFYDGFFLEGILSLEKLGFKALINRLKRYLKKISLEEDYLEVFVEKKEVEQLKLF